MQFVVHPYGTYHWWKATIYYDENLDRLLIFNSSYNMEEVLAGTFTDMTAVKIMNCDGKSNGLLVMKNTTNSSLHVFYYLRNSKTIGNLSDASGTTLTENSAMATDLQSPLLYYSNANKVYRYNYQASNFPTEAFITVADGVEIKSIVLSDEGTKIYIATYNQSASSEYKGDIYCYDIQTKNLLWKEEGVAGEVVEMIYKK
jgi:hypothetical protein